MVDVLMGVEEASHVMDWIAFLHPWKLLVYS
jgi:hypothetical protein